MTSWYLIAGFGVCVVVWLRIVRAPMSGSLKAAGSGLSSAWSVATKHVPAFTGGKVRRAFSALKRLRLCALSFGFDLCLLCLCVCLWWLCACGAAMAQVQINGEEDFLACMYGQNVSFMDVRSGLVTGRLHAEDDEVSVSNAAKARENW